MQTAVVTGSAKGQKRRACLASACRTAAPGTVRCGTRHRPSTGWAVRSASGLSTAAMSTPQSLAEPQLNPQPKPQLHRPSLRPPIQQLWQRIIAHQKIQLKQLLKSQLLLPQHLLNPKLLHKHHPQPLLQQAHLQQPLQQQPVIDPVKNVLTVTATGAPAPPVLPPSRSGIITLAPSSGPMHQVRSETPTIQLQYPRGGGGNACILNLGG